MSQYRSIQGIKYEKDLLEAADAATAAGRAMTKADAASIWEKAMDGNKVTATERRTLEYILSKYKFQDAGAAHLRALLDGKSTAQARLSRKGSSYYRSISGVSYDRQLLEEGESLAAKNGGFLNFKDALHLWGKANDGNGVTECEKRTLQFIGSQHKLEEEAKQFFEKSLECSLGPNRLTIKDSEPGLLKSLWRRVTGFGNKPEPQLSLPAPDSSASEPEAKRRRVAAPPSVAADPARALLDTSAPSTGRRPSAAPVGSTSSPEQNLQPELRQLLEEIMGGSQERMLSLECPEPASSPVDAELAAQRAKAAAEVERILAARNVQEVLGGGSKEEQHREFRRLALLLHPDKGFVDHDDDRANLAMRLAVAAHNRSRQ